MRFTLPLNVANLTPNDPDLIRVLSAIFESLTTIINGNIGLTDNVNANIISVNFTAANTVQAVLHGLVRVPLGYIQVGASAPTQIYNGNQANTSTALYVQSTVATTVQLFVF